MRVKITQCPKSNYWYYNKIGEIYEVDFVDEKSLDVFVHDNTGASFSIEYGDYQKVDEIELLQQEINQLKQRIENLEKRPPVYIPYPVYPSYPVPQSTPVQPYPWYVTYNAQNGEENK